MRSRLACASLVLLSAACHPRAVTQLGVSAPCLEAEAGKAGRNACRDAIADNPGEPKLHTRLAASHVEHRTHAWRSTWATALLRDPPAHLGRLVPHLATQPQGTGTGAQVPPLAEGPDRDL